MNKQHVSGCLQHTREQLLADIRTWIDHDSEKRIYWLNGMAGTGKTTISLTIAREYYKRKQLGASFFFSRSGGDLASTKRFATTMAVQLAEYSPVLRQHIIAAAASNPRISQLALYMQWEKLIIEPLGLLEPKTTQYPLLIIIDALDECDNERDMAMLLECFVSTVASVRNIPLRIFITSRPDRPINLGFANVSINLRQYFALHSIEQSIVDGDLMIYYRHQLAQLSQRHSWDEGLTSDDIIQSLVHKSHGLFIYAATVCRFIDQGGILAEQRLSNLYALGSSNSRAEQELDHIYTTVLENSFNGHLDAEETIILQQRFQKVVGSIMVLFDAFNLSHLAAIIDEPKSRIMSVLNTLGSVLDISEDDKSKIDTLHPSFRDFLLDSKRCCDEKFQIPTRQLHYELFERCLVIMRSSLHKDMCRLKKPGTKARDVTKTRVNNCIPLSVQYACSYWMKHLQKSERNWLNHGGVLDFFRAEFLGWLEVLALLGRLSEGMAMLAGLQSSISATPEANDSPPSKQGRNWIKSRQPKESSGLIKDQIRSSEKALGDLIRDAKRFAFQHSSIIEEAPLQVYCSALIFSPEQSIIRQIYNNRIPNWITPYFQRRGTWASYTQLLWHPHNPYAFAFSPNGKYLASGCEDGTVWLWDVVTGANQRILEGHSALVSSVDYSPQGQLLASGSWDGTIRLWNSTTGATQGILVHGTVASQVVFSPDGNSLASISIGLPTENCRIRLWNTASLDEKWSEDLHRKARGAISFLPDGKHVVYSILQVTGLLEANTGRSAGILAPYGGKICSSNLLSSTQIIGLGKDTRVELYDIQTRTRRWLSKTTKDLSDMAFSPNDRVLAVATGSGSIELLDAASGHLTHTIKCDTEDSLHRTKIKFSPDGTFLASQFDFNTIRFWDMPVDKQQPATYSDFPRLPDTTISGCGSFVAIISHCKQKRTGPEKKQLYIWEIQNLEMMYTFSLTVAQSWSLDMVLSPNTQFIAIESGNRYDLFDCRSGKSVIHSNDLGFDTNLELGHKKHIFSPDSKLIALYTSDYSIQIWDTLSLTKIHEIQAVDQYNRTMAFSPDAKFIAALAKNEELFVFDLDKAVHLNQFEENVYRPTHIYFLNNDRLLVYGFWTRRTESQIQLLDAHTGTVSRAINVGHRRTYNHKVKLLSPVGCIAIFDHNGHQKICEIWDFETGTLKWSFEVPDEVQHFHLLPCNAHLRIDEAIVPLSITDLSNCCSDLLSFEGFWIKRGDERLVFIPQDYASNLIAVRSNRAVFHPFIGYEWERFATSQFFDTLEFDFSTNGAFI